MVLLRQKRYAKFSERRSLGSKRLGLLGELFLSQCIGRIEPPAEPEADYLIRRAIARGAQTDLSECEAFDFETDQAVREFASGSRAA